MTAAIRLISIVSLVSLCCLPARATIVVDGYDNEPEWDQATEAINLIPSNWGPDNHLDSLKLLIADGYLYFFVRGSIEPGYNLAIVVYVGNTDGTGVGDLRTLTDEEPALDDALSAPISLEPGLGGVLLGWGTLDMNRVAEGYDFRMGWRDISSDPANFGWANADEDPSACSDTGCEARWRLRYMAGGAAPYRAFARIVDVGDNVSNQCLPENDGWSPDHVVEWLTTPATVDPGSYTYEVAPSSVREPVGVAFHPDGSYALVISQSNAVHTFHWVTGRVTTYDLTPASGDVYFDDLNFAPDGSYALIVGHQTDAAAEGVVYMFDDDAFRASLPAADTVFECPAARRPSTFRGVEFPRDGGLPMVLGRSPDNQIAYLHRFDPSTRDFTANLRSTPTVAGCTDLAFVDNEFGEPGILVVCGALGTGAYYRTSVGGVWEWRDVSMPAEMGNLSQVAAHPDGHYALVVDRVSQSVYRFQNGAFFDPPFTWSPLGTSRAVRHLGFQPDGERALIVGRASGSPLLAPVLEYRHDLFSIANVVDASIPDFDELPYLGTANTYVEAVGFNPNCEGGLLVARDTADSDFGLLIRFANEAGISCEDITVAAPPLQAPAWRLLPATPNPFNPATTLAFDLPNEQKVSLRVYDAAGRLVRDLLDGELGRPGRNEVIWRGRDDQGHPVSAGVYFYRLEAGGYGETRKMVLVR